MTGIIMVITSFAAVALLITGAPLGDSTGGSTGEDFEGLAESIAALEDSLRAVEQRRRALERMVQLAESDTLASVEGEGARLAQLKSRVADNAEAIDRFEKLMMNDAQRMVTLPLLRREVENTNEEIDLVRRNVRALRQQVEETNTQNRWLVGTVVLGFVALVVRLFTPLGVSGEDQ